MDLTLTPHHGCGRSLDSPINILDTPRPRTSPLASSPFSSMSHTSPSPSPLPEFYDIHLPLTSPPPLMNDKKVWPANMYVVDMVYGFRKMKELKTAHAGDYAQCFLMVFKQPPPPPSTYHDQVKRWKSASPALRDTFKSARRTSAGHWAAFASSVPLRGEKVLKQPKHRVNAWPGPSWHWLIKASRYICMPGFKSQTSHQSVRSFFYHQLDWALQIVIQSSFITCY